MHHSMSVLSTLKSQISRDGDGKFRTQPFIHPGKVTLPRLIDVAATQVTEELRISIPPGANVGRVLHKVLDAYGLRSGCGRIVGGFCEQVQYHVMIQAFEGVKPYVYGAPIIVNGVSTLIGAAITVGHKDHGIRIIHCHGGFVDEQGKTHGGHIILDQSFAGRDGLAVRMCLFDGVDLVVTPDTETTFDLLKPVIKS